MPPIHLLIKPASSLCNMRCKYCFYADVSEQREVASYGVMTDEVQEALIRRAFEYAEGVCTFAFQGGEPTMAGLPFFERFAERVAQYNTRKIPVHYAIQTNGYAINEAWARFFAEHKFLIGLSLDGDASVHNALRPDAAGKGTYQRVSQTADLFRRMGCDYNILTVVTRQVAQHGQRVFNHLKRHQFLQFIPCIDDFDGESQAYSLTPVLYGRFLSATFDQYYADFMAGRYVSERTFDNFIQMLLGQPPESCAMRGTCTCNPVIEGDGSVYPCDFYVLDEWKLGNVLEDSLADMMGGETSEAFVRLSLDLDPACRECRWFSLCRGGCRRDRERPGAALGRSRHCEAYQIFFEHSYERMREIASVVLQNRRQGRG